MEKGMSLVILEGMRLDSGWEGRWDLPGLPPAGPFLPLQKLQGLASRAAGFVWLECLLRGAPSG